jgi:ribosome-associated protein
MTRKRSDAFENEHGDATDRDGATDLAPSRSQRKRESKALTRLGEQLAALPAERWSALELPERLTDALVEAQRLTTFGAQRRQAQFIGKLVRSLDDESLARVRSALVEK